MNNVQQMAIKMIEGNPALMANPNAKDWLEIIKSGDSAKGEELARNLCRNIGIEPDPRKIMEMLGF